jgi:NCAIR mutase (PurE)-related protein
MTDPDTVPDSARAQRIGLPEAIYAAGKTPAQIAAIIADAAARAAPLLLTRLSADKAALLPAEIRQRLDHDEVSQTAYFGAVADPVGPPRVAVVTAGTSDVPVATEVIRTLRFHRQPAVRIADVGVAGLWRLLDRVGELRSMPVVIVAAGMDAALPSVVAGLVRGAVIAVPTSVGYGVAAGGHAALNAVLASCAPGLVVVNIDNGYGAACAALRILGMQTWNDAPS